MSSSHRQSGASLLNGTAKPVMRTRAPSWLRMHGVDVSDRDSRRR